LHATEHWESPPSTINKKTITTKQHPHTTFLKENQTLASRLQKEQEIKIERANNVLQKSN
jgi:hypothetical protein